MKPNKIILIRHGQSEGNIDKNIYNKVPDYALKLTEVGQEQALKAGLELKEIIQEETAKFYISPLWRTRMTFDKIATFLEKDRIKSVEEPRLREQEWGHLRNSEASAEIEKDRDEYGTFYFRIPDGESCADVYDRVSDFLGSFHRDFEKKDFPQNAIIITHGMTIRLFLMRWYHWTVEQFEVLANPKNCAIIILEKNENGKYDLKTEMVRHEVYNNYQYPLSK